MAISQPLGVTYMRFSRGPSTFFCIFLLNSEQLPYLPALVFWRRGWGRMPELKSRFRTGAKIGSGVIIILLLVAALGPAKWAPRTELGWQFDHFIGYFGITLFFCFAWPRPFVIGGVVMAVAALLEALQALTPDRSANRGRALRSRWGISGGSRCCALHPSMEIAS